MSKSFRDAVRQVMVEGAKEKTSDGMTPDAKHFRHDLHKVQDAGFKHMVQKDSETKDYERMFKPSIDKMPTRLSDVEPDQGVDKYVEYNEAVRIAEDKKKKHMKGCTCQQCMDKEEAKGDAEDDKQISEVSVMPAAAGTAIASRVATKAADAKQTSAISAREPAAPAPKPVAAAGGGIGYGGGQMGSTPSAVKSQTRPTMSNPTDKASSKGPTASAPRTSEVLASKAAGTPDSRNLRTAVKAPSGEGATGKALAGLGVSKKDRLDQNFLKSQGITAKAGSAEANLALKAKMQSQKDAVTNAENPKSAANAPSKPAMPTRPGQQTSGAAAAAPKPGAGAGPGRSPSSMGAVSATPGAGAGPGRAPTPPVKVAANPQASQAAGNAAQRGPTAPQGMSLSSYGAKYGASKGTTGARSQITQSYEIEVNGQSYYVSENHAAAIAAYVEKYGEVNEKSDPNVGKFISKEMEHPDKLTAKSKKQKIKQAIAIYYSKKRHGEKP